MDEKTILEDFKEKYPDAECWNEGHPKICPNVLGYNVLDCSEIATCAECWAQPLKYNVLKKESEKKNEKEERKNWNNFKGDYLSS